MSHDLINNSVYSVSTAPKQVPPNQSLFKPLNPSHTESLYNNPLYPLVTFSLTPTPSRVGFIKDIKIKPIAVAPTLQTVIWFFPTFPFRK